MSVAIFFTETCLICGVTVLSSNADNGICPSCINEIRRSPGPFCFEIQDHAVFAAREYAGIMQQALQAYKQHGFRRIGKTLAEELLLPLAETVCREHNEEVLIVSVPPHPGNRRTRGFDQAHDLAVAVANEYGCRVGQPFRRQGRATQKSLARDQREINAQQAITLRRLERSRHSIGHYQRYILVDDVVTTGATVRRCTDLLKMYSTAPITVLTLAATL